MTEIKNNSILTEEELREINGGSVTGILIGVIVAPFVLGAIAGGADEYARKKGHK